MDVSVSVPTAAQLTGLGVTVLREAIATGSLPASLRLGANGIKPYHVRLDDLAAWCRACGYTHLWANPDEIDIAPRWC